MEQVYFVKPQIIGKPGKYIELQYGAGLFCYASDYIK
jgi:hypothetical protein